VIHNDFRPENILSSDDGFKICDFGCGKSCPSFYNYEIRTIDKGIEEYTEKTCEVLFRTIEAKVYKCDISSLTKKLKPQERGQIFEEFIKPELDKNDLITIEQKEMLKSFVIQVHDLNNFALVSLYDKRNFIKNFLLYAFCLYKDTIKEMTYENQMSVINSIIDGWQNFIRSELGYKKIT
jgi:hypothetical protein